jgi:hypothetical protein
MPSQRRRARGEDAMVEEASNVVEFDAKLEAEIEQAIKNIYTDTRWVIRDKWVRTIEIMGRKVAVHLATNNKQQYDNFAANFNDVHRLLKNKEENPALRIYIVATKTREYRRHAELGAFYEKKLRDRPTQKGWAGKFWSVEEYDFDDPDAPL